MYDFQNNRNIRLIMYLNRKLKRIAVTGNEIAKPGSENVFVKNYLKGEILSVKSGEFFLQVTQSFNNKEYLKLHPSNTFLDIDSLNLQCERNVMNEGQKHLCSKFLVQKPCISESPK